jgi:DNA-binding NarL/FixJ family response regulator
VKTLRILLADDHEVVRQGMRALLEARPDWEVCAEAANGREAVEMAKRTKPDVVVMDISMPELNGLEATRQVLATLPGTEVLILTLHESEQLVRRVVESGARAYVLKSDAGRNLVEGARQPPERTAIVTL